MTVQVDDKEHLRNTLVEPMPTATTAGVAGAGAYAAAGASTVRKIGEKVLKWQASQGCQRIPNPRSLDEHERSLGKSFQDVLRRRYGAIGEKPCQQQLSADEIHFISGIPGVPSRGCSVKAASPVNPWPPSAKEDILHPAAQQELAQGSVKRRRLQVNMQDDASPAYASCEVSVTAADPNAELARQRLKRIRNVHKKPLKWLTRARVLSWDAMFEAVDKWVRTHQGEREGLNFCYPNRNSKDKEEKKLAFWLINQRSKYHGKRGRVMNESRREMLENLPGWKWTATSVKESNS